MALVGALKVIADQPDAVVVIIFPDDAFKYASSFERHFPDVRAARPDAGSSQPTPKEELLSTLVENSRNPHNTWEAEDLRAASTDPAPFLLDVRSAEVYTKQHVVGAPNVPLAELGSRQGELPQEREQLIVTVCNRGNPSISGMLFLQSLGYRDVRSLNGGTIAWAEQGLPTKSL
jgi:rhodanese-related sulfurtransferase